MDNKFIKTPRDINGENYNIIKNLSIAGLQVTCKYVSTNNYSIKPKQAGAELGQAQVKLEVKDEVKAVVCIGVKASHH